MEDTLHKIKQLGFVFANDDASVKAFYSQDDDQDLLRVFSFLLQRYDPQGFGPLFDQDAMATDGQKSAVASNVLRCLRQLDLGHLFKRSNELVNVRNRKLPVALASLVDQLEKRHGRKVYSGDFLRRQENQLMAARRERLLELQGKKERGRAASSSENQPNAQNTDDGHTDDMSNAKTPRNIRSQGRDQSEGAAGDGLGDLTVGFVGAKSLGSARARARSTVRARSRSRPRVERSRSRSRSRGRPARMDAMDTDNEDGGGEAGSKYPAPLVNLPNDASTGHNDTSHATGSRRLAPRTAPSKRGHSGLRDDNGPSRRPGPSSAGTSFTRRQARVITPGNRLANLVPSGRQLRRSPAMSGDAAGAVEESVGGPSQTTEEEEDGAPARVLHDVVDRAVSQAKPATSALSVTKNAIVPSTVEKHGGDVVHSINSSRKSAAASRPGTAARPSADSSVLLTPKSTRRLENRVPTGKELPRTPDMPAVKRSLASELTPERRAQPSTMTAAVAAGDQDAEMTSAAASLANNATATRRSPRRKPALESRTPVNTAQSAGTVDPRRTRNMIPTGRQLRHSPVDPPAATAAHESADVHSTGQPVAPRTASQPVRRRSPRLSPSAKRARRSLPAKSPLARNVASAVESESDHEGSEASRTQQLIPVSKPAQSAKSNRNIIPTGRQLRHSTEGNLGSAAVGSAAPEATPMDSTATTGPQSHPTAEIAVGPITSELMARALASVVAQTVSISGSRRKRRLSSIGGGDDAAPPTTSAAKRRMANRIPSGNKLHRTPVEIEEQTSEHDDGADPSSASWVATPLEGMRPFRKRGGKKAKKTQEQGHAHPSHQSSQAPGEHAAGDEQVRAAVSEATAQQPRQAVEQSVAAGRNRSEPIPVSPVSRSRFAQVRRARQPSTPVTAEDTLILPLRPRANDDDDDGLRDNTTFNLGRLMQHAKQQQQPQQQERHVILSKTPDAPQSPVTRSMARRLSAAKSKVPQPSSSSSIRPPASPANSLLELISPSNTPRSLSRGTTKSSGGAPNATASGAESPVSTPADGSESEQSDDVAIPPLGGYMDDDDDDAVDEHVEAGAAFGDAIDGHLDNYDDDDDGFIGGGDFDYPDGGNDDDDDDGDDLSREFEQLSVDPSGFLSPGSMQLYDEARGQREQLVEALADVAADLGEEPGDATVADVLRQAGLRSPSEAYGPLLERRVRQLEQRMEERRLELDQLQEEADGQFADSLAARRHMEAELAERAEQMAELKADAVSTDATVQQQRRELAERDRRTAGLRADLADTQQKVQEQRDQLQRAQRNLTRLREVAEAAAESLSDQSHSEREPISAVATRAANRRDQILQARINLFNIRSQLLVQ